MARNDFGYRRALQKEKEKEKARRRTLRFGVFVWHENPRYPESEAIKVFKRESAAQKFADLNFILNYVVREIE